LTLGGRGGSLLDVTITASNATGKAVNAQLQAPIPAAVASSMKAVRFGPGHPVTSPLLASRVAVWDLHIPARGSAVVGYQVREALGGATEARLQLWVRAFAQVASQQDLEPVKQGAGPVLQYVTITPPTLQLTVGQSSTLTLEGSLPNGTSASAAELARAVWRTANSAVASVNSQGEVVGISAGVTRIIAHIGSVRASAVVTVVGRGAAGPGPGDTYGPPAGQSMSPTSSPSPTSTASPTTSPSSTGSPPPTTSPSPPPPSGSP
jgi:hypothetical protein